MIQLPLFKTNLLYLYYIWWAMQFFDSKGLSHQLKIFSDAGIRTWVTPIWIAFEAVLWTTRLISPSRRGVVSALPRINLLHLFSEKFGNFQFFKCKHCKVKSKIGHIRRRKTRTHPSRLMLKRKSLFLQNYKTEKLYPGTFLLVEHPRLRWGMLGLQCDQKKVAKCL